MKRIESLVVVLMLVSMSYFIVDPQQFFTYRIDLIQILLGATLILQLKLRLLPLDRSLYQVITVQVFLICFFIANLVMSFSLMYSDAPSRLLFGISLVVLHLLPLLLVLLVRSFHSREVSIWPMIPASYIFVYYLSLHLISKSTMVVLISGQRVLTTMHPLLFNHIILMLSYVVLVIQLIYPFRSLSRYSSEHFLFITGVSLAWLLSPSVEFMAMALYWHRASFLAASFLLRDGGIFLTILAFIASPDLFFKLLNLDRNRLVVMNNAGLPVFSYNFATGDKALENSMIFSGSFQAIFQVFTASLGDEEVRSLDLTSGKLSVIVRQNLTFLLLLKHDVIALLSCFKRFSELYSNAISGNFILPQSQDEVNQILKITFGSPLM